MNKDRVTEKQRKMPEKNESCAEKESRQKKNDYEEDGGVGERER